MEQFFREVFDVRTEMVAEAAARREEIAREERGQAAEAGVQVDLADMVMDDVSHTMIAPLDPSSAAGWETGASSGVKAAAAEAEARGKLVLKHTRMASHVLQEMGGEALLSFYVQEELMPGNVPRRLFSGCRV